MTEFEAATAELADAMTNLLGFADFRRSTEPGPASPSIYRSPAAELRRQADAIEARDAAITRARNALQAYSRAIAMQLRQQRHAQTQQAEGEPD